jgi:hypothetical protein
MFHCGHVYDQAEYNISYTQLMQFKGACRTPEIQLILLDNKIHCRTALQFALQTDIFVLSHKINREKVVRVQAMKAYGRVALRLHSLLPSALDGGESSDCCADVLATSFPGKVLLVSTK